ncbi:LuxR family transcriptional regulator [Lentzea aerocolonigenes]|uniref:LuxR family transcriptional regulator n=1 Tax=Lentzea aerocolonigenes TaxID=68170 RepID=A0A0F0GLD4_LENAE|nr:response regulator transcription factor [Lentzea aerocolonigenes]KJK42782.1 LuxR family transcriptional regulator [Lentzea aerocolonigenes]
MIRVMLVDDQVLMRRGLRTLLDIEDGIEVVAEAANGEEALNAMDSRPDVALVDARMPVMDGVALIGALKADHPGVACIVLTTFEEDEYIFGALKAGALGYLLKDTSPDDLVAAIHKVAAGQMILDSPVAARLVAEVVQPEVTFAGHELLSSRESDVVELVGTGASNREIAARLYITEGTVKNHVSSALRKLGLRDRTQLALVVRERWRG